MPHSPRSCCFISVCLYRYMISASFSTLHRVHIRMRPCVRTCVCLYVCAFVYVFHYVVWWLCSVMLFNRADCFELLDAFSCGLRECVCVPTVSTHVLFRMPFSCVYAHVRACSAVRVLWYHVVFDVLVQVRFGRFLRKIEEC